MIIPENDERCGHVLCGRTWGERMMDDADCAIDDCPFRTPPPVPPKEESTLLRAIRDARGGEAPTDFWGFA